MPSREKDFKDPYEGYSVTDVDQIKSIVHKKIKIGWQKRKEGYIRKISHIHKANDIYKPLTGPNEHRPLIMVTLLPIGRLYSRNWFEWTHSYTGLWFGFDTLMWYTTVCPQCYVGQIRLVGISFGCQHA